MLLRHTLLYLPAQCITPLIQFSSILIWAHLLAPADLGIVTLVIAMQELSFAAFFMWWSHYALRFIASFKDDASRGAFLSTEVAALLCSAALQSIVVVPAAMLLFPTHASPALIGMILVFMITRSLNNYAAERARSETAIALYTIMQTVGPLFGLGIGLAMILAGAATPMSVFAGFAVAQAGCIAISAVMSDVGRGGLRPDGAILKRAARFGIPVMAASMLALVAVNVPRFVVEQVEGLTAVGMFAVGYGLGLRASSFASMLVTAGAYPLLVRKMELEGLDAAYEQLAKNMTLVALVVVPVVFGLLAVNRAVVDLVVPADYRALTYAVLPVATIGGLLRDLRVHTTDQVFLVRSRPGLTTIVSTIDLVAAVVSCYIGLKLFGTPGAAIGPMVSGAATLLASLFLSWRLLDFRVPVQPLVVIVATASVMLAVVASLDLGPGLLPLAVRVGAGATIYTVGIALFLPVARRTVFSVAQTWVTRLG